jgi:hypothetical protein
VGPRFSWVRLTLPAAAIALILAGAEPGLGRTPSACEWGASSMAGKLVDGEFVVTEGPTTTGCVPPR